MVFYEISLWLLCSLSFALFLSGYKSVQIELKSEYGPYLYQSLKSGFHSAWKFVNILAQRARLWVTPGRGKFALPTEGSRKVVPMFFIYRTDLSVLGVSLSVSDTLHIFGSYPNLSLLYQHSILWPKNCCPSMACSLTF
jgi:hypothetical protein